MKPEFPIWTRRPPLSGCSQTVFTLVRTRSNTGAIKMKKVEKSRRYKQLKAAAIPWVGVRIFSIPGRETGGLSRPRQCHPVTLVPAKCHAFAGWAPAWSRLTERRRKPQGERERWTAKKRPNGAPVGEGPATREQLDRRDRHGFFAGYLKNAEATDESWRGGWFHTGDGETAAGRHAGLRRIWSSPQWLSVACLKATKNV